MRTKIHFQHIAYEKKLKPVIVDETDPVKLFPKIQNILINKGLVQRNLEFRWNPEGDGVNFVINHTSSGRNIIARFTLQYVD